MNKNDPFGFDMSVSSAKKKNPRGRRGMSGASETSVRLCEHEGCEEPGKYRAPKAPDVLDDYFWFCQQHVREYNLKWNFFHGTTEADINAGRFDGAEVTAWLVNWRDVTSREVQFKGSIGEMKRADGAFHAELRGLSEVLNTPVGRVFQKPCQAVLGDKRCCVDLTAPGYRTEVVVERVDAGRVFRFAALAGFDDRWFERGRLEMLSGPAERLVAMVKNDRVVDGARVIELWEELRLPVAAGDLVMLEAGCDKRIQTCRLKFQNISNFQGFPHIPGEDWLMTYPQGSGANDGGSRYR